MWCSLIEMKYPYSSRIYILTTGCLESGVESGVGELRTVIQNITE